MIQILIVVNSFIYHICLSACSVFFSAITANRPQYEELQQPSRLIGMCSKQTRSEGMRRGADVTPVGTGIPKRRFCVTGQTWRPRGPFRSTAGRTDVVDLRATKSNSVRVECAVTAEEQEQVG